MGKNKVDIKMGKDKIEYVELVEDFVGLVFHCPNCNAEMHLQIAKIDFEPKKIIRNKKKDRKKLEDD